MNKRKKGRKGKNRRREEVVEEAMGCLGGNEWRRTHTNSLSLSLLLPLLLPPSPSLSFSLSLSLPFSLSLRLKFCSSGT